MGFLDRLLGRREEPSRRYPDHAGPAGSTAEADERAIERYRYMVRTAPPETVEQAHQEAFSQLTPEQRAQVLRELAAVTPPNERPAPGQDDPRTLARLATRAELRQPGVTERALGSPGLGMGGLLAGSIFSSFLAGFLGSMVAHQFFDAVGDDFSQPDLNDSAADSGFAEPADSGFGDTADFGGDFGGDI
jgi:hypothetical protein